MLLNELEGKERELHSFFTLTYNERDFLFLSASNQFQVFMYDVFPDGEELIQVMQKPFSVINHFVSDKGEVLLLAADGLYLCGDGYTSIDRIIHFRDDFYDIFTSFCLYSGKYIFFRKMILGCDFVFTYDAGTFIPMRFKDIQGVSSVYVESVISTNEMLLCSLQLNGNSTYSIMHVCANEVMIEKSYGNCIEDLCVVLDGSDYFFNNFSIRINSNGDIEQSRSKILDFVLKISQTSEGDLYIKDKFVRQSKLIDKLYKLKNSNRIIAFYCDKTVDLLDNNLTVIEQDFITKNLFFTHVNTLQHIYKTNEEIGKYERGKVCFVETQLQTEVKKLVRYPNGAFSIFLLNEKWHHFNDDLSAANREVGDDFVHMFSNLPLTTSSFGTFEADSITLFAYTENHVVLYVPSDNDILVFTTNGVLLHSFKGRKFESPFQLILSQDKIGVVYLSGLFEMDVYSLATFKITAKAKVRMSGQYRAVRLTVDGFDIVTSDSISCYTEASEVKGTLALKFVEAAVVSQGVFYLKTGEELAMCRENFDYWGTGINVKGDLHVVNENRVVFSTGEVLCITDESALLLKALEIDFSVKVRCVGPSHVLNGRSLMTHGSTVLVTIPIDENAMPLCYCEFKLEETMKFHPFLAFSACTVHVMAYLMTVEDEVDIVAHRTVLLVYLTTGSTTFFFDSHTVEGIVSNIIAIDKFGFFFCVGNTISIAVVNSVSQKMQIVGSCSVPSALPITALDFCTMLKQSADLKGWSVFETILSVANSVMLISWDPVVIDKIHVHYVPTITAGFSIDIRIHFVDVRVLSSYCVAVTEHTVYVLSKEGSKVLPIEYPASYHQNSECIVTMTHAARDKAHAMLVPRAAQLINGRNISEFMISTAVL
ncbi:hypothetical protein PCE1_002193 [Barthelona sp. PCE]